MGRAKERPAPQNMELNKLKESKNPQAQELCRKLAEGVEKILAEGELAEFLQFAARFRRYSPANIALIFSQRPEATQVAGLKTWNSLGRKVRKGEKGIAIFAPTVRKVWVEETGPGDGERRRREEKRLTGFHVAYVFDVSQTEGKPLPEPPEEKSLGDSEIAEAISRRLLEAAPAPVTAGCALDLGVRGEFDPVTGTIKISRRVTASGDFARTLLHECAHALAFAMGVDSLDIRRGNGTEEGRQEMYARGEAIAEGAAFVAAAMLGLDTFGLSAGYIAGYVRQAEKLLAWLGEVQKVADGLFALARGHEGGRAAWPERLAELCTPA